MMETTAQAASGVEALIEKLHEKGVRAGQEEASRLIEEAERRADWLLQQAKDEAEQIRHKAKHDAEQLCRAGNEALSIAARDMHLEVKEMLVRDFSDRVERLVSQQMDNPEMIRQLVLQIAGKVKQDAGISDETRLELKLPESCIGLEELRQNPQEYRDGELSHLVQSLMRDQLQQGVSLTVGKGAGIRVKLVDQHAEIDLSDRSVAALLLRHLQPRFRAILEGVIR